VGAFGAAMERLKSQGFIEPLQAYLKSNKPFMGICVGMQVLFESSEESPGVSGLGLIPAHVSKFESLDKVVPHMGWNSTQTLQSGTDESWVNDQDRYYFVHSFAVKVNPTAPPFQDWIYSLTTYGSESFVSSIRKGNIFATQFHPEKSGQAGLDVLAAFLTWSTSSLSPVPPPLRLKDWLLPQDKLSKRIIACLDVRANDQGDLVVTKGDQYDVRDKDGGHVRNLGILPNNIYTYIYTLKTLLT
jgi:glutamine amidotransferase/cyclase